MSGRHYAIIDKKVHVYDVESGKWVPCDRTSTSLKMDKRAVEVESQYDFSYPAMKKYNEQFLINDGRSNFKYRGTST